MYLFNHSVVEFIQQKTQVKRHFFMLQAKSFKRLFHYTDIYQKHLLLCKNLFNKLTLSWRCT